MTYSLWKEKLDFHLKLVLMSLFPEQKERILGETQTYLTFSLKSLMH